jgi:hypothetical protein
VSYKESKDVNKTDRGKSQTPPVAVEANRDPTEDILGIVDSANRSILGLTSDSRLLESGKVVSTDFSVNVLADSLQLIVLLFNQIAELRGELVEDRTCSGILLDEGLVRGCELECVVVAGQVDESLFEQNPGLDAVGEVNPDDGVGRDGLEDLLTPDDQVVFHELCDHGYLWSSVRIISNHGSRKLTAPSLSATSRRPKESGRRVSTLWSWKMTG